MFLYLFYRRIFVPLIVSSYTPFVKCRNDGEKIISAISQISLETYILMLDTMIVSASNIYICMIISMIIGNYCYYYKSDVCYMVAIFMTIYGEFLKSLLLHLLQLGSIIYPIYRIYKQTMLKNLYFPEIY